MPTKTAARRAHTAARFSPGLEGKTWEKCRRCGRPLRDKLSRLRHVGPTCFDKEKKARAAANAARAQLELQRQLPLFPTFSVSA